MRSLEFPYHFKFQNDETNDKKGQSHSYSLTQTNKQTNVLGFPKYYGYLYVSFTGGCEYKEKTQVTMAMENIFNNNKKKIQNKLIAE